MGREEGLEPQILPYLIYGHRYFNLFLGFCMELMYFMSLIRNLLLTLIKDFLIFFTTNYLLDKMELMNFLYIKQRLPKAL